MDIEVVDFERDTLFTKVQPLQAEYDHRLVSNFKIANSYLNIGDKNCFLLEENHLLVEKTIGVHCSSPEGVNSVQIYDLGSTKENQGNT